MDANSMKLNEIKNKFYIGEYQLAINLCCQLKSDKLEIKEECEVFMYRCYLAQKKFSVLKADLQSRKEQQPWKSLLRLADYLNESGNELKEKIYNESTEMIEKNHSDLQIPLVAFLESHILFLHSFDDVMKKGEDVDDDNVSGVSLALNLLRSVNDCHNCLSFAIYIYLQLRQYDEANSVLKMMKDLDEDHILTHLSSVWINLATPNDSEAPAIQEARYTFQDLSDRVMSNDGEQSKIFKTFSTVCDRLQDKEIDDDNETTVNGISDESDWISILNELGANKKLEWSKNLRLLTELKEKSNLLKEKEELFDALCAEV
ncbi:hypothetical protein SNEBB_000600 [Seison nebaliae]|nr:hypothetical protein SNEBB_000600 [Seison nebaliae]